MLRKLRVENYKSFKEATEIEFSNLNVLLGKNNSGKTTIARLPLLLSEALSAREPSDVSTFPLVASGLRFGSTFTDLVSGQTPHSKIRFGVSYDSAPGGVQEVDMSVQLAQSLRAVGTFVSSFRSSYSSLDLTWALVGSDAGRVGYNPPIAGFTGALPISKDLDQARDMYAARDHLLRHGLTRAAHIGAVRAPIRTVYENRDPDRNLDHIGSEAPYELNVSTQLAGRVANWYHDAFGVALDVSAEANAFSLSLRSDDGVGINLANAGQGLQQVLAVATTLLAANMGLQRSMIVIEEPELHLHPAAHGALADLFVEAVNGDAHPQIIVETHSENFVLRLRRRVASGELDPESLNLLWVDESEGQSYVRRIEVLADGSVDSWPRGVFSEDLEEVRGILQARR